MSHPTVLQSPLASGEAMANVESLLAPAHVRVAGEGDDFWRAFRRIAAEVQPRGKLVPDSHLVALMDEHGLSTIWTHDRDFRKFSGITVKDPFDKRYSAGFG